jgi:RNA polymerase sigma-70 factor (ECF subfamily)
MNSAPEKSFDPTIWVDEHGNYLFAFAYSRVRDEAVAEDLVQETLLSAIKSFADFQGKSSERSWLTGILKEKIIDYFRRMSKEKQITAEEADFSSYQNLFADKEWNDHWTPELIPQEWEISPDKALGQNEFCEVLEHCLGELPQRVANAFLLREMDELMGAEICDIFGISQENYWVMLHRARTHLRRCLEFDWFRKGEIH